MAQKLLQDESAADDIVQEVWRASLNHPASDFRDSQAWFVAVTKNIAKQELRRRYRRDDAEHLAEPRDQPPGQLEQLSRDEVSQRLLAAIDALDPETAAIIKARYFDGQNSTEIGLERGHPASTVRVVLQRGLADLRIRLASEFGGRDGLYLALIGGFRWTEMELIAPVQTGIEELVASRDGGTAQASLDSKSALPKWAAAFPSLVALTLASLAIVVGWAALSMGRGERAPIVEVESAPALVDRRADFGTKAQQAVADKAQLPTREPLVAEALDENTPGQAPRSSPPDPGETGATAAAANGSADGGVFEMLLTDADRQPLSNGTVYRVENDVLGEVVARANTAGIAQVRWVESDLKHFNTGDPFVTDIPRLGLMARAPGRVDSPRMYVDPTKLASKPVLAVLRPGALEIHGHIVDSLGAPVPRALVSVLQHAYDVRMNGPGIAYLERSVSTLSGIHGEFTMTGLNPDDLALVARVEGRGVAFMKVSTSEDSVMDVELVLHGGSAVVGTVTDAAGTVMEDALVEIRYAPDAQSIRWSTRTDASGAFELRSLPMGRAQVRIADEASWSQLVIPPGDTLRFDRVLGTKQRLDIDVLGPYGEPVEGAKVVVAETLTWSLKSATTNEEGRATFEELPSSGPSKESLNPEGAFKVFVFRSPEHRFQLTGLTLPLTPSSPVRIDLTKEHLAMGQVNVSVLDSDGAPISGAVAMFRQRASGSLASAFLSDVDGSCTQAGITRGEYDVYTSTPWSPRYFLSSFQSTGSDQDLGQYRLPAPGQLTVDWRWTVSGEATQRVIREVATIGSRTEVVTVLADDGSQTTIDLLPGRYVVIARDQEGRSLQQDLFVIESGVERVTSLGPGVGRSCLCTFQDEHESAQWIEVTMVQVPTSELPPDADRSAQEAGRASAEVTLTRRLQRGRAGDFALDFELDEASWLLFSIRVEGREPVLESICFPNLTPSAHTADFLLKE